MAKHGCDPNRDYQLPRSDQLTPIFEITARAYLDHIRSSGLELKMARGLDAAFEMRRTKKSRAHHIWQGSVFRCHTEVLTWNVGSLPGHV